MQNGQTPLHGAVSQSWDHVVEYLGSFKKADCKECKKNKCSKHKLDVNAQDKVSDITSLARGLIILLINYFPMFASA